VRTPKYSLERLQSCVAHGDFTLGHKRCLDVLIVKLKVGLIECREFVQQVVSLLSENDFSRTKVYEEEEEFDVYGIELPDELLDAHALDHEMNAWYFKFRILEGDLGHQAVVVSLHPLDRAMARVGGFLSPKRIKS